MDLLGAIVAATIFALLISGCYSQQGMSFWPTADVQQIDDMKLGGVKVILEIDRVNETLRIVPERTGSQIRIEYASVIGVDYRHAHDPDGTSKHVPIFENKEHWVLIETTQGTYILEVGHAPERMMALLAAEGFPITMVSY